MHYLQGGLVGIKSDKQEKESVLLPGHRPKWFEVISLSWALKNLKYCWAEQPASQASKKNEQKEEGRKSKEGLLTTRGL